MWHRFKRQLSVYSPHGAISSRSNLLQANVLDRDFPYRTVDLFSTEFPSWLHLAMKENRQRAKRSPRTQRLLRDIMHPSSKRSLRRNNSFTRQNITAVHMVPYSAERPRNRRFKSLAIESSKRSWCSNALRAVWRWRHDPRLTPTFEFKQPLWLTQCCSPCKHERGILPVS